MTFSEAINSALTQKYVTFSGRARRSEFWWFALFQLLATVVAEAFAFVNTTLGQTLTALVGLGLFLPYLAVSVRRLHDVDRSGWWLLIGLIPLIGGLILLVWDCTDGTAGPNRFGEDPKQRATAVVSAY